MSAGTIRPLTEEEWLAVNKTAELRGRRTALTEAAAIVRRLMAADYYLVNEALGDAAQAIEDARDGVAAREALG